MASISSVKTAIERTASQAVKWSALPASKKVEYLQSIRKATEEVFREWSVRAVKLRGWDGPTQTHLAGGAMLMGSGMLGMHVDAALATYKALASTGKPPALKAREYKGQTILNAFPHTLLDGLIWPLYTGEVWVQPGKPATQGTAWKGSKPGCAGVFGPGNYDAPVDILTKLFVDNKTVVYKFHPTMAPAADKMYAYIFKSLVDDGYLSLVSGELEVGETILHHNDITEVMMTGGCQAYDCIMWGSPSEQAANKKAGARKLHKKFEAELGCVSPWLVVPSKMSSFMLKHQVEWLCSTKAVNGGASCASPQIVIVDKKWPQLNQFVSEIREFLTKVEPTPNWYPGSSEKRNTFEKAGKVEWFPKSSKIQTLFLPEVTRDSYVVRNEAFSPVLAILPIDTGNDPRQFLAEATKLANEELMGSLSCTVAIAPKARCQHAEAFQQAIADLKYGTVGVNEWGGASIFFGSLLWGAHFGRHTPEDIQSGEGFIGNHRLIDFPQKCVLEGTWLSLNHNRVPGRKASRIYERMSWFALNPSVLRLNAVTAAIVGL